MVYTQYILQYPVFQLFKFNILPFPGEFLAKLGSYKKLENIQKGRYDNRQYVKMYKLV